MAATVLVVGRGAAHAGSVALDIVREGDRLKIPVPNCKAVYRLVKGLELAGQRRVVNHR